MKRVNYYHFSVYLKYFKKYIDKYKYLSFTQIREIYEFDVAMRSLLFPVIGEIELYLRTQITYYHCQKYGADGYLNPENFNKKHNHMNFLNKIETDCVKRNSGNKIIKHHQKKYDGKYPLWVIVEFFSAGTLSKFYSDMTIKDKKELAKTLFNVRYHFLENWLKCFTILRNTCAHYSRLYFLTFINEPVFPKEFNCKYNIKSKMLFSQLLVLKFLSPDKQRWNIRMMSLKGLIKNFSEYANLEDIGFPEDWFDVLTE